MLSHGLKGQRPELYLVYWIGYLFEASLLMSVCMHERIQPPACFYCSMPPGNESRALSSLQKVPAGLGRFVPEEDLAVALAKLWLAEECE